jgi:hypothetical protein
MFIEWTSAQAETETAAKLVELQVQLALWQLQWQIFGMTLQDVSNLPINQAHGQSKSLKCPGS